MRPYSANKEPKGISGCRKSKVSAHRSRSLRVDRKAARQQARLDIEKEKE